MSEFRTRDISVGARSGDFGAAQHVPKARAPAERRSREAFKEEHVGI